MFRSLAFIGVLMFVIVALVRNIPGGFVPEEDQGYIMVNAQLPDAASLERTDAVMKKAEAVLKNTESVEGYNAISGFSLLTGAYSSNMGFFFVQLKPWEHRGSTHTAAMTTGFVIPRVRNQPISAPAAAQYPAQAATNGMIATAPKYQIHEQTIV